MNNDAFVKNRGRINLVMSQFTIPLFRRTHDFFHGDFAKVIILGEIAHRNVEAWFAANGGNDPDVSDPEVQARVMRPANALSISESCGIPRETVRRKVNEMISSGWLYRDERGYLYLVPGMSADFDSLTIETVKAFIQTADCLKVLVAPEAPHPRTLKS